MQAAPQRREHSSSNSSAAAPPRTYEMVLDHLSSLITFKTRADGKGWRDAFENMPIYLEVRRGGCIAWLRGGAVGGGVPLLHALHARTQPCLPPFTSYPHHNHSAWALLMRCSG